MSQEMQTALTTDDHGTTPQQEAKERANQKPIDISYTDVDPETGEVIEPGAEEPESDNNPAPDAPQELSEEKPRQTTPKTTKKLTSGYNPAF